MGISSLTLGITGLFAWLDPFLGFPISIAGIILGFTSIVRTKEHKKKAITGVVLSFIGLILSIIAVFAGIMYPLELQNQGIFNY